MKILKRKIYSTMLDWKEKYAPDYALFIKGARRVGKTTIAEEFGKRNYKSYITINFQEANNQIKDLFVNSLLDLNYLFHVLENMYDTILYRGESLIILDEIQIFPKVRQALKTFLKDGRFDYIETGSLAGIGSKSKDEAILLPSEEYAIEMYPLDFEEFLWATQKVSPMDIIKESFEKIKPLNQLHRQIFISFRKYMCVGGMPAAVVEYAQSDDFVKVDFIKNQILNLYKNDVKDQKAENSLYLDNIINSIPSQLSRHGTQDVKLFKVNQISSVARLANFMSPIKWLNEAMLINIARCTSDPSPALTSSLVQNYFKCYFMDTGLLINLAFQDGSYIDNKFYGAILFDKLHVNEGMFVENVVSQELVASGHNLIFYVKYENTGRIANEVDFLIRKDNKVCPIEVRSGKKKTFKSMDKFKHTFTNRVGQQYVLYEGDVKREDDIIYLPYYMAGLL